jgi:hypothetical protein
LKNCWITTRRAVKALRVNLSILFYFARKGGEMKTNEYYSEDDFAWIKTPENCIQDEICIISMTQCSIHLWCFRWSLVSL